MVLNFSLNHLRSLIHRLKNSSLVTSIGKDPTDNRERKIAERILGAIKHNQIAIHLLHTDIFRAPGGLERFVYETTKYADEKLNLSSLIIFPLPENSDHRGDTRYGLLADHQSLTSVTLDRLLAALITITSKHDYSIESLNLQHWMNWEVEDLLRISTTLKPIAKRRNVFIHDYGFICRQHNLLWNDKIFCNAPTDPATGRCNSCNYGHVVADHREKARSIFKEFDAFICPSAVATELFCSAFPELLQKTTIRPHLILGSTQRSTTEHTNKRKIAILFLGATGHNKGIERFTTLIEKLGDRFRYVTIGIEDYYKENPLVEHIHYSFFEPLNLEKILTSTKPAIAFLGSVVPETFSYTLYETLEAGLSVLTTVESGNIARTVSEQNAGRVFNNFDEMLNYLVTAEITELNDTARNAKKFAVTQNTENLPILIGGTTKL